MEQKKIGNIITYKPKDTKSSLRVKIEGETVWLTQAQMAQLFQTTPQNITIHIRAIYRDGELSEKSTCKEYLQVGLRYYRNLVYSKKW